MLVHHTFGDIDGVAFAFVHNTIGTFSTSYTCKRIFKRLRYNARGFSNAVNYSAGPDTSHSRITGQFLIEKRRT
jgi:hypothetical protein